MQLTLSIPDTAPVKTGFRFSGSDYNAALDEQRLTGQVLRIYDLMKDGKWRTLSEIEAVTRDGQSSISAQLRNLRKPSFGSHKVEKRRRTEQGLFEYRILF